MFTNKPKMMSALIANEKRTEKGANAFSVRQMLVALELGYADEAVLRFLDYFSKAIPVHQINMVHVAPRFDLFQSLYEPDSQRMITNLEFNREVIQEMQNRIRLHPLHNQTLLSFDLREGDPLEALLEESQAHPADLTVIGQRTDSSDHGILAANLVRKSKGDVLIIPEGSEPRIDHIIVPVDFSPNSVKALERAFPLREAISSPVRITCVNVYELPNLNIYLVEKIEDVRRIIQQDRKAAFRAFLTRYAPEGMADFVDAEMIERQFASVASYLYDFAIRESGALIVMGAKGHSRVERMLLGSVTENLLKLDDSIPVLVVR